MRLGELIAEAIRILADARIASPRVDAELLASFVLGVPRGALLSAGDPSPAQASRYRELIRARAARVPLQHLTGTAPFRHRELTVGPGVFVPRPETEQVVEWGLRWLRARAPGRAPRVVDLCAGSGAIAAAVASEEPGTSVWAVESDPAALEWLRRNVCDLPVTVVAGDVTDPVVLIDLDGTVDLVLCNPPYVPETRAADLPPEVSEHDPHAAVFGGPDGLDVIRPLIGRIGALLRPGGACAIEHDETHAEAVPALMRADGRFTGIAVHHDLNGHPRFTTATRAGDATGMADLGS